MIAVNYDGFEGDPGVIFTDVPTVAEKIEDYIITNHGGGALEFADDFIDNMKNLNPKTISREFYSDYVTPLEDGIHADGTTVHVIYALKMGAKYGERYRRHFREPDIHEFDMKHEVWLYDEKWRKPVMNTIDRCMEGKHDT